MAMNKFVSLRAIAYFIVALFVAVTIVMMLVFRHAHAGSFRGLTSSMIKIALNSAHINTAPGSQMKLFDISDERWHDFILRKFTVKANGRHATIEIDADEVN
jgi:hypothetical protein